MNRKEFAALASAIHAAAIAAEPTAAPPFLGGTKADGRAVISISHANLNAKAAKRAITAAVRSVVPRAVVHVASPLTGGLPELDSPEFCAAAIQRGFGAADIARLPGRPMTATSRLADVMRARHVNRRALAAAAGVALSTVAALLAGGTPRYDTAVKISRALGVTPETLWPIK